MKTYKYSYNGLENEHILKYFKEIDDVSFLEKDEEIELLKVAKKGNEKARNKILKSNLKFVAWVASRYQDVSIPFSDLIQEGNIGLITAIDRFDIERGLTFKTYAFSWVKQAILQHKASYGRTIRLPFHQTDLKRRIEKSVLELVIKHHREPSIAEIAESLGETVSAVDRCMDVHFDMMYIDSEDEKTGVYADNKSTYKSPEYSLSSEDRNREIDKILSSFPEMEKEVLVLSFGLNGNYEESLSSIAKKYSSNEEKIRNIKTRAIKRFRKYAEDNNLNEYLNLQ